MHKPVCLTDGCMLTNPAELSIMNIEGVRRSML
jgi:hypothetical protein